MLNQLLSNYQSEEDDDYNPTKKEEAMYRQQQQKKKKTRHAKLSTHELWLQAQNQYKTLIQKQQKRIKKQSNPMELANQILNNKCIKPDRKIIFAGKQFLLNQQTGQLELVEKKKILTTGSNENNQDEKQQQNERETVNISYQYLNHVMRAIYNRGRKINSIGKSKLDWNGFVKQEGIQEKLRYNRKGGVIENIKFMNKTK